MKTGSDEASFDELDELNHVPLTTALEALTHPRRRELLFELLGHGPRNGPPVGLTDLGNGPDATEHRIRLIHVDLPKLADCGFIDWNRETHEVRRGPNFDEIEPLLRLLVAHEDELPDGRL